MGLFNKLKTVLDTKAPDYKQLLADADRDIARLENELNIAKQTAADIATKARHAANDAAAKAKLLAELLAVDAEEATKIAINRSSRLSSPVVEAGHPAPIVDLATYLPHVSHIDTLTRPPQ